MRTFLEPERSTQEWPSQVSCIYADQTSGGWNFGSAKNLMVCEVKRQRTRQWLSIYRTSPYSGGCGEAHQDSSTGSFMDFFQIIPVWVHFPCQSHVLIRKILMNVGETGRSRKIFIPSWFPSRNRSLPSFEYGAHYNVAIKWRLSVFIAWVRVRSSDPQKAREEARHLRLTAICGNDDGGCMVYGPFRRPDRRKQTAPVIVTGPDTSICLAPAPCIFI